MIVKKSQFPVPLSLLKNETLKNENNINSIYTHIQDISNLRSFKWVQHFKVYNFKTKSYHFSNNYLINPSLINKWNYISSLFRSLGILITKLQYSYTPYLWEIRFGYYISNSIKSNSNINNRKNYIYLIDPIANNNTLNKISGLISNLLKSNVRLIAHKLHTRWQDNTIILETLSYYSLKRTLGKLIWRFFAKSKTFNKKVSSNLFTVNPGNLTGLFIKVAGRSFRIKLTNRRLVAKYEKGRYARKNTLLIDSSRSTRINRYGTFSITTTTAHTM